MPRVIKLGLGEVVSNWGQHGEVPAVFIEPAIDHSGEIGRTLMPHEQPQIRTGSVSEGGLIIEIHDVEGMKVVIDDMWSAIHAWQERHPEPLKCSDCMLIHGKSVCTMNCGPSLPARTIRS